MLQIAIDKIQSCNDIETAKSIANSVNSNQVLNKLWLVNQLQPYIDMYTEKPKVCVAAGWHGLAAHMIGNAVSFDMDPICKEVKLFSNVKYQTSTIEDFDPTPYDIIICTSCEHITDNVINDFIAKKKPNTLVLLQSNNYYYITEHINCKQNCEEFTKKINLKILEQHTLNLEKYDRFMLVGL
jgi:hypothetical protein